MLMTCCAVRNPTSCTSFRYCQRCEASLRYLCILTVIRNESRPILRWRFELIVSGVTREAVPVCSATCLFVSLIAPWVSVRQSRPGALLPYCTVHIAQNLYSLYVVTIVPSTGATRDRPSPHSASSRRLRGLPCLHDLQLYFIPVSSGSSSRPLQFEHMAMFEPKFGTLHVFPVWSYIPPVRCSVVTKLCRAHILGL